MTDSLQPPDAAGGEEWWNDPNLPWRHAPTKTDVWCLAWMGFVTIYSLVMMPLRPLLLVNAPQLLGALGFRTGLVMEGALARVGDQNMWWVFLLAGGLVMKFNWVYWWAGRLWGRAILDIWLRGRSARSQRGYERAWALAHRFETLAIILTFVPLPLPAGVIYASLGAAGTSFRKLIAIGTLTGSVMCGVYLYLGYAIGDLAVTVVDTYAQWITWSSAAILVAVVATTVWRNRRAAAEDAAA